MPDLRTSIADQVRKLVGSASGDMDLSRPPGDLGLISPDSPAWRVHGDFGTMMIGGVSALLMQMLHPAALAGVWDHSNFRKDMAGRLKRTAQFIAGTTFGSTERAGALIDRVRRIHDHVGGVLPDGTPYEANDPATLNWVHVAGSWSFLAAYVRYREPGMSHADRDRYYADTAVIARRLGAEDVPETARGVEACLRGFRHELKADGRTREVVRALLDQPAPHVAAEPVRRVLMQAGIDLMPDWASTLHGLHVPIHRRLLVRGSAAGVGGVLRWALQGGAETRVVPSSPLP